MYFFYYSNNIFFKENKKIGAIDFAGEIILKPEFEFLDEISFNEDLLQFKKLQHFGLISLTQGVVLEVSYDFEIEEVKNYYIIKNNTNNLKGLLNQNYDIVLPVKYSSIDICQELLTKNNLFQEVEYFELELNNKKGLYIIKLNKIIFPIYDNIDFIDFFFFVKMKNKEGVFDFEGNEILECFYSFGKYFNYGVHQYVEIENNNNYDLFDLLNKKYILQNYKECKKISGCENFVLQIKKENLIKYKNLDTCKETIYQFEDLYEQANAENDRQSFLDYYRFSDERLIIKKDGQFGFMDKNFVEIIKCQFENALPFKNGRAEIHNNHKTFFIDIYGNKILL